MQNNFETFFKMLLLTEMKVMVTQKEEGEGDRWKGKGEYGQKYRDKFTQWQMTTRISGPITL